MSRFLGRDGFEYKITRDGEIFTLKPTFRCGWVYEVFKHMTENTIRLIARVDAKDATYVGEVHARAIRQLVYM